MSFVNDALGGALRLYLDAALFVLFGCVVGGLVYAFFPGRVIERWLGGRGVRTILGAALVGTPLPLCSCGVVPAAITLRRRGASTGATVSFLVATPETGPDSILASFALLDPLFALFRPVAAIATAVVAGVLAALGDRGRALPQAPPARLCEICALPDEAEHRHGARARLGRAFSYAFRDLVEDIGPWLLVGFLLGGALAAGLGEGWVAAHLPSRFAQMVVAMAVGVPIYVCASASTPLAAAAVAAGFSPGAALVLMLAGPATNLASLLVLRRELGGAVVGLMLLGIAVSSFVLGFLLDALYAVSGLQSVIGVGAAGELMPAPARAAGGALLAALIAWAVARKLRGTGRRSDCETCRLGDLSHAAHHAHAEPHPPARR